MYILYYIVVEFLPIEPFKDYVNLPQSINSNVPSVANGEVATYTNADLPSIILVNIILVSQPFYGSFFLSEQPLVPRVYPERVDPIRARLSYFCKQAPRSDVPSNIIIRIEPTLEESRQRMREINYNHGIVIEQHALEAFHMNSPIERYRCSLS